MTTRRRARRVLADAAWVASIALAVLFVLLVLATYAITAPAT